MLYSLKKNCHITLSPPPPPLTATSPQRPLSSVPKVALVETFDFTTAGRIQKPWKT